MQRKEETIARDAYLEGMEKILTIIANNNDPMLVASVRKNLYSVRM